MAKKAKKSSFRGKVGADSKRQQSQSGNYGYLKLPKGISMYAPVAGAREKIDIIPYMVTDKNHPDKNEEYGIAMVGDLWYKRPFRIHRNVGGENESVICLQSFGKKCPICEYRKKQAKEGASKDELKAFNSSLRNLYYVIPRGVKKREEEVHLFDISQFQFQELLNDEVKEDEDFEVFPEIDGGYTLQIRWSEETFAGNKFAKVSRIDFKDRESEIEEDILGDLPSLDELFKVLTYDQLEAKFFEIDREATVDEDEDEDEDEPKRKKKSDKSKSKKKDEDEDEDEEDLPFKKGVAGKPSPKKSDKDVKKSSKMPKLTWEELEDMEQEELSEVIDAKSLDLNVDDYENENQLRKAIALELDIDVPQKQERSKKEASKSETKGKSNKCPHDHKFGVDTDSFDDCEDCKLWDACYDAEKKGGK